VEFHRNGRLTKGLTSTSIALNLKVENPQRLANFTSLWLVTYLKLCIKACCLNLLWRVLGSVAA